jgi:hypothetical protein
MSDGDEAERRLRIDALFLLAKQAWRSFDTNRSYEWKMTASLWATLGAFSALLLKNDVRVPTIMMWPVTIMVAAIFFAYWAVWTMNGWRLNYFDTRDAYADLNKVRKLIGENELSAPLRGRAPKDDFCDIFRALSNWSRFFQVFVTLILALITVAAIWVPR